MSMMISKTANLILGAVAMLTIAAAVPTHADQPPATRSTHFLKLPDGQIAYDDTGGTGPLVICVPGLGDMRQQYRLLAPKLAAAGFRVVTMDLPGHGESSVGWPEYSPASVGAVILVDVLRLALQNCAARRPRLLSCCPGRESQAARPHRGRQGADLRVASAVRGAHSQRPRAGAGRDGHEGLRLQRPRRRSRLGRDSSSRQEADGRWRRALSTRRVSRYRRARSDRFHQRGAGWRSASELTATRSFARPRKSPTTRAGTR